METSKEITDGEVRYRRLINYRLESLRFGLLQPVDESNWNTWSGITTFCKTFLDFSDYRFRN